MSVMGMLGISAVMAMATPGGAGAGGGGAEAAIGIGSVWGLIMKGGWIMLPIGLCSLVAIAIIAERVIVTKRTRVAPPGLAAAAAGARGDSRRVLDMCAGDDSPAAAVISAAVRSRGEPIERRERLVQEAGLREVGKLRQRVRLLSALPQTATMLGLLGTVFGMIRTFTVIAVSGESLGKTERLAQGIYEAWTATAAGLAVAIPVLVAYHLILSRIDAAAAVLDRVGMEWLEDRPDARPARAAAEETGPVGEGVAVAAA
ncbi:MAG: MotA/TolQ/ExbB proton channel family protein [Phycisphaerales bacterium]|nr:MotA/TolQ/ExbB proton channel family protein [Phycisphaerales bacterium]